MYYSFFFFNDTATTEIYTLSLHDALPISTKMIDSCSFCGSGIQTQFLESPLADSKAEDWTHLKKHSLTRLVVGCRPEQSRSEEHTSELQSRQYLVCRLLLEKKKSQTHDRA